MSELEEIFTKFKSNIRKDNTFNELLNDNIIERKIRIKELLRARRIKREQSNKYISKNNSEIIDKLYENKLII